MSTAKDNKSSKPTNSRKKPETTPAAQPVAPTPVPPTTAAQPVAPTGQLMTTPVVEPQVDQVPVPKKKSSRAKKTVVQPSDSNTEQSTEPAQTAEQTDDEKMQKNRSRQLNYDEIMTLIDDHITQNDNDKNRLKESTRSLKEIKKFLLKTDQHQKKIKQKPKVNRKPTGFARPRGISDEMLDFLTNTAKINEIVVNRKDEPVSTIKIEPGCKLARNELTKVLCYHFKNNNMRKDPSDQRKIYLDQATSKLFRIDVDKFRSDGKLSDNGEAIITYFDLQKYLPIHCTKDE